MFLTIQFIHATGSVNHRVYVVSRPDLFNLLWRHIPHHRINLGKRILSFQQCETESSFTAQIIIEPTMAILSSAPMVHTLLWGTSTRPPSSVLTLEAQYVQSEDYICTTHSYQFFNAIYTQI